MYQHTCVVCDAPFESRSRSAKYCNKPCKFKAYDAARITDGRLADYRAKNRERRNAAAKVYKLELVPCSVCGELVKRKTSHKRQFVCGDWCRNYLRWGKWPSSEIPALHPIRSTLIPLDHPIRVAQAVALRIRFVVGQCLVCGSWTTIDISTGGGSSRVCSKKCFKRRHRLLRRSRLAAVVIEDVHPYKVHTRDKWICYLCGNKVDRKSEVPNLWAPTLDHVIPIVAGGPHTYENIKTAHFICNCLKRDRELNESLVLNFS